MKSDIKKNKSLKIMVITLSTRASKGIYDDKSGPAIVALLTEFFEKTDWKFEISTKLIADDSGKLEMLLMRAINDKFNMVFTTGGTGVGPDDKTPDVIFRLITKHLPGIMDNIRLKYGQKNPNALLSRSVAGIARQTQIYALPGSPKAVQEYVPEILKTAEHLIYMIHNIDIH